MGLLRLGAFVRLKRGQSYSGLLVGEKGPALLGLGTIERNGGFRHDNYRTYGGESPDSILARPGDLYVSLKDVTHAADLLGAVARVPADIPVGRLTQDTMRLDVDERLVLRDYLYWVLRSPAYRAYCRNLGTGTTNLDLSQRDFLAYQLAAPSLSSQRAIAEALGAIDDKIGANQKASSAALALADSLFVGAKQAAGLIATTFDSIASAAGGGTPSTKVPEYWGGDTLWVTPTDVTALGSPYLDSTARRISQAGFAACSSALYPVGSILMTSRATIGAFALAKAPVAVNQGFIVAHACEHSAQLWLFHEMRTRVEDFLAHANGATFLELSKSKFKAIPVDWPTESAAFVRFAEIVSPIHDRAYAATVESRHLATLRDTLLPLLMSGLITVREAEQRVEEVL